MISEVDLVDDFSLDGTGWARFDWTRRQRFRLGRAISERAKQYIAHEISVRGNGFGSFSTTERYHARWLSHEELIRVVFVMLNPSTADAFEPDRTVGRCMRFAELWGADVLEVVNLFALISPYPEDLLGAEDVGANMTNDDAIIAACTMPNVKHVVAAWGRHGGLLGRGEYVAELLLRAGVGLKCLGTTDGGYPTHPLARGKSWIPYTRELTPWLPRREIAP